MNKQELQAKVSDLLNAAGHDIEREFFNSEMRDAHSKWDSDEITEFRNELSDAGISFNHEDNYGGEDMGSEYWSVYTFTAGDVSVHVKFDGYYQSFDGSTYKGFHFVSPTPVQKIEWR